MTKPPYAPQDGDLINVHVIVEGGTVVHECVRPVGEPCPLHQKQRKPKRQPYWRRIFTTEAWLEIIIDAVLLAAAIVAVGYFIIAWIGRHG